MRTAAVYYKQNAMYSKNEDDAISQRIVAGMLQANIMLFCRNCKENAIRQERIPGCPRKQDPTGISRSLNP